MPLIWIFLLDSSSERNFDNCNDNNLESDDCFCYSEPENDFEYSICKEKSNCENKHVNDIKSVWGTKFFEYIFQK